MVVASLELALSGLPCQEEGESPMSPNQRGVNVGERKMVVGEKVANKVSKKRVAEVAETWNRTSPSVTSVRNLGNSPRVPGGHLVASGERPIPGSRNERGTRQT